MSKIIAAIALLVVISLTSFSSVTAAEPVTVSLAEQNGSGQTGTATLTPMGAQTEVVISVTQDGAGAAVPAYIYAGQCSDTGPVVFSLADVANGRSTTIVNAPIERLTAGGLAINVHFLPEGAFAAPIGSCGAIPLQ